MASAPETTSTLDGIFKRRYADNVTNLLPDFAYLLKKIPFNKRTGLTGELMQIPVRVKVTRSRPAAPASR
jgi:hypothetical protein